MVAIQTKKAAAGADFLPASFQKYTVGFRRPEGFEMTEQETIHRSGMVKGVQYNFEIQLGKLRIATHQLEGTFLLEVPLEGISNAVSSGLPLNGFGSHSSDDCIDTALSLVGDVLKERGLTVCNYLNGWPIMRMVLSQSP